MGFLAEKDMDHAVTETLMMRGILADSRDALADDTTVTGKVFYVKRGVQGHMELKKNF